MRSRSNCRSGMQEGFSLVEVMVAMVAGLILIGSVIALVVSSAQVNAATMRSVRLTQELRALTEIVVKEVRRARYSQSAISNIGLTAGGIPTSARAYDTISISSSPPCIQFSYQRTDGNHGRTFVLRSGQLMFGTAATPPTCVEATTALSSPQLTISTLSFVDGNSSTADSVPPDTILLTVAGSLSADTSITRSMSELIRLPSARLPTP